jgi:NAD(P)-dependent dehydrogenase (short-subunit alcohol dehydrogenase family)
MTTHTHQTAPTQFVEANGIRFAYRRFGKPAGVPLVNPAAGDWATPQKAVTALNRYGSVEEVAALVAFVAGPEASYITGANLTIDGGTNA